MDKLGKNMNSFVIGIGSQRAGSTLLHKVLSESTSVFMHPIKELHYFDTLFNVRKREFLDIFIKDELKNVINFITSQKQDAVVGRRLKCHLRSASMLHFKEVEDIEFADLFRPFLNIRDFVGEVTPEYMILPEEGVKHMAESVGKDAKIILLSRDPVDRFLSSFKLLKLYRSKEYDSANLSQDLRWAIDNMETWMIQQDELNDYERSLELYNKYFDNVLFYSFESMTSDPETFYTKLKDFLGMDVNKEKFLKCFGTKVNQIGGESYKYDAEIVKELEERYSRHKAFLKKMGHL